MEFVPNQWTRGSIALSGLALSLSLSLVACSPSPEKPNSVSPTPKSSHTSATPTAEISPTPTVTAFEYEAAKQDITCSEILTADAIYDLNPNLIIGGTPTTALGSYSQQSANLGGVGCTLINMSTGQEFQVFLTKLTPISGKQMAQSIESLKSSEKTYEASIGVTGAYSSAANVGTAQFMNKDYWVVIAEPLPGGNVNTAKLSNLIYTGLQ